MKQRVCVIGIGYIGLPLVAALAKAGFLATGLDINEKRVSELNEKRRTRINEQYLFDLLDEHKDSIEFTTNAADAISKADCIIITVGTPVREDIDVPDFRTLNAALDQIGNYLKKEQTIILKSTVVPGTTADMVVPKLEKLSGLKAGEDFFVAYSPERTVAGKAIEEFSSLPKIVGGINEKSVRKATAFIEKLGGEVIAVSSASTAELCKITDNLFRAHNIAFANELGFLCEKLGISSQELIKTINYSYSRNNIFGPGLGADGPCLLKDTKMFTHVASQHNVAPTLAKASLSVNTFSDSRIVDMIRSFSSRHGITNPKIAFFGVAFKGKPETDDVRESPAHKIYTKIQKTLPFTHIVFHDPLVTTFSGKECISFEEALHDAHIVLFLTNHPKLMDISADNIIQQTKRPLFIVDSWGNVRESELLKQDGIEYFRIGE